VLVSIESENSTHGTKFCGEVLLRRYTISTIMYRTLHYNTAYTLLLVVLAICLTLLLFSGVTAAQTTANDTISGTVTNASGQGIPDVTVNITGVSTSGTVDTTNNDGEYELTSVPVGVREIRVAADTNRGDANYTATTRQVTVSTTTPPTTDEDFQLDRITGTLSGTVSASDGSDPIENTSIASAEIRIEHNSAQQDILNNPELVSTTTTNQDGEYSIEVPIGDVDLSVTQDGFDENDTISIKNHDSRGTEQDAILDANFTDLTGFVTTTDGGGIQDATVSVTDSANIWPGINSSYLTATTGSGGKYTIKNVPNTTTRTDRGIKADADIFRSKERDLRIDANPYRQNFTLQYDSGTLSGTVTDSHGNALKNINIRVEDSQGNTATAETDANGEYKISDPSIVFGTLKITASHRDYKTNQTTVETERKRVVTQDLILKRSAPVDLSIKNISPTLAQSGDTVDIAYSFEEEVSNTVEFEVIGITGPETLAGGTGKIKTVTIPSRDQIDDGSYTVRFTALGESKTESIFISNTINPEAVGVLGEPVVRTPAGDFASIPTGGQYMLIGGNVDSGDRQQYLDILHVSGGSTTLNTRLLGTDVRSQKAYGDGVTSYAHTIGADAGPTERNGTVFEGVSFESASSLAEFRSNIGIGARSAPIQAGRYQLVAGEKGRVTLRDDGDVGLVKSVGRSNLVLTQTQRIGDITTYVLPPGKASETTISEAAGATETQSVAIGERLVIEVPATGMWGATLPDSESEMSAEQIANLLSDHEGIRIEFAPRHPFNDPNAGAGSLRFSDVSEEDLNVIADTTTDLWENETTVGDDPTFGGYYIVIDTRGTEPFDNRPGDEEYMRFEMAYESPPGSSYQFQSYDFRGGEQPAPFTPANEPADGVEHYPYFGDDDTTVQENTTVLFKQPSVQYDRVMPDGDLIVPSQSDGQIFGSTTIAPESQVTIQLISGDGPNPDIVTIEDVEIDENRRFEAQADFSTLSPGQSVEVEFYAQNRLKENRLIDSRDVTVVDNIDNPAQFIVQSLSSEVTVQQRASLGDIQATIRNTGSISGQKQIEFRINDEPIKNETIILGSNTNETLDLSDQFVTLPVGTYDYTVRTEDDAQTGVLRVAESESGTTVTNTGSATTTSSSVTNEQTPSGNENEDSSSPGLFSIVGVSGRDVALGAALTGTAHVLGYWT